MNAYLQIENPAQLRGKEWLASDKYQPFRWYGASLGLVLAHLKSQPLSRTHNADEWTTWLLQMIFICGLGWGRRQQMVRILDANLSLATAIREWWVMMALHTTTEERQVFFIVNGYGQVI